ncbi:hypothetical protein C2845_PM03G32100 [Panicum miliaceum]|uniref:Uncharacterized protein n=1 Tax=Panicum miliaceum TaxID=4540 RepID=A0A3L6T6L3_PANMI|nr:hypothetical protein C2845_PM03G32100 [Panicum miliaceum]
MEREHRTMYEGFVAHAQRNQILESDIQREIEIARRTKVDQSMLAQKLDEEITLRLTTESKLIQAEPQLIQAKAELAELRTRQAEMKVKEEAHLAAMELMKDKADRTLKTWMESDSIRVNEIQELLDQLPEEYQLVIRKEDFLVIPKDYHLKEHLLENLPPSGETEKVQRVTTNDWIFPEGYPEECQTVQACKKPRCSEDWSAC